MVPATVASMLEMLLEGDIKASFENGTLKMTIPKKEAKAVPEKKFISIEG